MLQEKVIVSSLKKTLNVFTCSRDSGRQLIYRMLLLDNRGKVMNLEKRCRYQQVLGEPDILLCTTTFFLFEEIQSRENETKSCAF